MNDQTNSHDELNKVLKKIQEIVEKSADGDYIYRGEPECYPKVSSSLFRQNPNPDAEDFDIENTQSKILEEVKSYIGKTDPFDINDEIEILTELQHFGGKTNLIDFTEDYLIAMFFACDGSHEVSGRIILMKRESTDYDVRKPKKINSRVESQKSIFVKSTNGFIEPDKEIIIPAEYKEPLLSYLRKYHRLSVETIYNDLHGFIKRSATTEFLKGLSCQTQMNEVTTEIEKQELSIEAIKHYTEAIRLKPAYPEAYNNRGNSYRFISEYDLAIQDYDRAIQLNPELSRAYGNRSIAYYNKGKYNLVIKDCNKLMQLRPEAILPYLRRAAAYEQNGEYKQAIKDCEQVLQRKPNIPQAYFRLQRGY